jgi:serralysin
MDFYYATGDNYIAAPGEMDLYPVQLNGGFTYAAQVSGASTGGGTLYDPAVFLLDEWGNILGSQDDFYPTQFGLDPYWEFDAPYTGTFYIAATDLYGNTGSYGVELTDLTSYWGW